MEVNYVENDNICGDCSNFNESELINITGDCFEHTISAKGSCNLFDTKK